jgi:hypothetical protein
MCEIYSNSYLTLVATIGKDVKAGFLRDRTTDILPQLLNGSGFRCRTEIDHVDRPSEGLLLSQAWCYHERLIPRRVLSYRVAEVAWECRTTHWCECRRGESYSGADRFSYECALINEPLDEQRMYDYWHQRLLDQYTQLSLTLEKDRPAAISALATQFQERLKTISKDDVFVAGFWRSRILESLAWRCLGHPGRKSRGIAETGETNEIHNAPSWSWASFKGPINLDKVTVARSTVPGVAQVLHVPDNFSRLPENNRLRLRGKIFKAQISIEDGYTLRRCTEPRH